uniref:Uncharacterized protein n=1 Tax=Vespula pensylvanica TaxID=30213 RepID=A0A834P034_VESPE|nr:hypothetical protein H0235_008491 [Vespula pensylvanica]
MKSKFTFAVAKSRTIDKCNFAIRHGTELQGDPIIVVVEGHRTIVDPGLVEYKRKRSHGEKKKEKKKEDEEEEKEDEEGDEKEKDEETEEEKHEENEEDEEEKDEEEDKDEEEEEEEEEEEKTKEEETRSTALLSKHRRCLSVTNRRNKFLKKV